MFIHVNTSVSQNQGRQTLTDFFSLPYAVQPFSHGSEVGLSPCPAVWALSMSTKMHPERSTRAGGRIKGQSGRASTATIIGTIYRDVHTQQETELKETVHYLSMLCVSALCTTLTPSVTPLSITPLFLYLGVHTLKHTHTHTAFSTSHLVTISGGALGAVGSCFQSLRYSAFSSGWTCPSQCVSLACLNYSHHDHYWERSPPHPLYNLYPHPTNPKKPIRIGQGSVRIEECRHIFLWSGGVPKLLSMHGDGSPPLTFILGWIIEGLPAGTERTVNVDYSGLSCHSTDHWDSAVSTASGSPVFEASLPKGITRTCSAMYEAARLLLLFFIDITDFTGGAE